MRSKIRLITALLLVVALVVPVLSATPALAQTCYTTYNFDVCPGGAYYSDEEDGTPPLDASLPSGPEATGSEYTAIATSDNSRWETDDPGSSDYVFLWLDMPITEIPGNITNIELTFEGYGDGGDGGHFQIYAYNHNTPSWVAIGSSEEIDEGSEETFSRSIPSSWADYIDGCGVLSWGVYFDDSSENIWVDYVKAVVTAGGSTTYDFSNITVMITDGYYIDVDSMGTGGPDVNTTTEATAGQQDMIDTSDDSRWQSPEPGYQDYVFLQFEMLIAEAPGVITNVDLTWEGYGEITGTFQIWADDTTDGWVQIGSDEEVTTGNDETVTRSITSNWADYINGSGVLTWAVFFNEYQSSYDWTGYWVTTDYVEAVISSPCPEPMDYGDAPDSYGTLFASNGARHAPDSIRMGPVIDAETDGQPTANADGDDSNPVGVPDDEDGVTGLVTLTAGDAAAPVTVNSNTAGAKLDAWIDFDANGAFEDPAEHLWGSTSVALVLGDNALTFQVPLDAAPGLTYARFRLSTNGSLAPTGLAGDGEVEDYQIEINGMDFGDAPDSYGTLFASNGARHIPDSIRIGPAIDAEADGQPTANADGDDSNGDTPDDEDGVTLPASINQGDAAAPVTVNSNTAGAMLDAWIDFDDNGAFDDPTEHLWGGTSQTLSSGDNALTFKVPLDAELGSTYARFRLSANGSLGPTGPAGVGEVEDYPVEVLPPENPDLASSCGLDVVLVLDSSDSISDLNSVRNLANVFVNAFMPATPTAPNLIGVVEFDNEVVPAILDLTGTKTAVQARITLISQAGASDDELTNWEAGLTEARKILENDGYSSDRDDTLHPDLIILISDGEPTTYGYPTGLGSYNSGSEPEDEDIASAVLAANAAKTSTGPIRIIYAAVSGPTTYGQQVSGPNVHPPTAVGINIDAITADFSDMAGVLADQADECLGTITVEKVTDPSPDSTSSFDFTVVGGLSPSSFSLKNGEHRNFIDVPIGSYDITETVPDCWELDVVSTGGDSTPITDGVTVDLDPGEDITVTFTNTKIEPLMTIDKDVVTDPPVVEPGGQVTYQIVVANTGSDDATGVSIWDALTTGFTWATTDSITYTGGASGDSTGDDFSDTSNPFWAYFTIPGGGSVTITFTADVDSGLGPGTYENWAYADGDCFDQIDDDPPVSNDPDTPQGEDPNEDENVTIEGEEPEPTPTPPSGGVGGEAYPINKVSVFAPWLGLILILAIGGGMFTLRRRRAH
ncbi:GEVED domain-containing protein [Chloroflexota bacterium]